MFVCVAECLFLLRHLMLMYDGGVLKRKSLCVLVNVLLNVGIYCCLKVLDGDY